MEKSDIDEALFRDFQSNLLSLISHELKTPLTGILNSLVLLESVTDQMAEPVAVIRQNALKLNQTLLTLLDLAELESKSFHIRLREMDLFRLVQGRFPQPQCEWDPHSVLSAPVLGDPQKLGRAIDLCFQVIRSFGESKAVSRIGITSNSIRIFFKLSQDKEKAWNEIGSQGLLGIDGEAPFSAFGGLMQREQAFLARTEEGLGSELLLIHEILRCHGGKFLATAKKKSVELHLELPEFTSEARLHAVLASRVHQSSLGIDSVTVILISIPDLREPEAFIGEVKENLFRTTDIVYGVSPRKIAILLDSCKISGVVALIERLQKTLDVNLVSGFAHCPSDGFDPEVLFELAQTRLEASLRSKPNEKTSS